ncbi:MAG: hypothetical protein U0Z44_03515 [Kouleothrix sp.]
MVAELGPAYDQVVLLGYPPFLKDIADAGRARGLDWSRFAIKLVLAGEVFSEEAAHAGGRAHRQHQPQRRLGLAVRHGRCRRARQRDAAERA